ncbi:hypothetical protein [Microvirga terricola]|uniref:Mor transcription activator domain-containing protein n=1 Tax=Microvirga terricola TaxID=2719797 RepID=A0ABX0V6G5_9HYPH|nr:hypothetical protein [Microvirga terricola]NIX75404.1 hypothetical protein [Microvirga terricola]
MTDLPAAPPAVQRLIDLIGEEKILAFIEHFAGQRIYVPRSISEQAEITTIVGAEAALALATEYGGGYLTVPVAREWRVLVYKSQNLSYRYIAKRAGTSEGNVWRILDKNDATQSQLDLFST